MINSGEHWCYIGHYLELIKILDPIFNLSNDYLWFISARGGWRAV